MLFLRRLLAFVPSTMPACRWCGRLRMPADLLEFEASRAAARCTLTAAQATLRAAAEERVVQGDAHLDPLVDLAVNA
jgi:hypothetical protein